MKSKGANGVKKMKKATYIILFSLLIVVLLCSLPKVSATINTICRDIRCFFTFDMAVSFGVDAERAPAPITADQVDHIPEYWNTQNYGYWFSRLNSYTLHLLKDYMQENHLAIVPKDYVFESSMTIEQVLSRLEFTEEYPHSVVTYTAKLQSEATRLTVIAVASAALLILSLVCFVPQIRKAPRKKGAYLALFCFALLTVVLLSTCVPRLFSYSKDIAEESYVQYLGPVEIEEEQPKILGCIPMGEAQYRISFEQDGKRVELQTEKDATPWEQTDRVCVIYGQSSGHLFKISGDLED